MAAVLKKLDADLILLGVQVDSADRPAFEQVLDQINYRYWEETDNRAYQLYLGRREPKSPESQ